MKTDDILNLDCSKEENKAKINKFLMKIKPVQKKNGNMKADIVPLETLEHVLHGIMLKYGYRAQGINTYYEAERFVFYSVNLLKKRETSIWIGVVYGKTMWEVVAKMIIKVYADCKREKQEQ